MLLILADANTGCLPAFYVVSFTGKQGEIGYIMVCGGGTGSHQICSMSMFLMVYF